jgi:hypothetical protein
MPPDASTWDPGIYFRRRRGDRAAPTVAMRTRAMFDPLTHGVGATGRDGDGSRRGLNILPTILLLNKNFINE